MANYEEQNRIANPEVAWQNQLTVVTSSLATANTARENATTTMGNNYNSLPSNFKYAYLLFITSPKRISCRI
jgi:hypothetical protein